MTQTNRRFLSRAVLAFSGTVIGFGAAIGPQLSAQAALQDTPKAIIDEAWQIVNREYVDRDVVQKQWVPVRQKLLSRDYANKDQAYAALREAFKTFNDPYTRFMDPKQFNSLDEQIKGELEGVGIRLEVPESTKILTVDQTIPGSPATKAGVQSGDLILAIDGKSTKGLTVEDARNLIRGKAGTSVVLRMSRKSKGEFNQPITRDKIELQTVDYALRQEGGKRIGYIRLAEFSEHAHEQMERAIKDLSGQNVEAFVLDLRGNPGGLLNQSLRIGQMWLDKGTMVKTTDRTNVLETIDRNGTVKTKDKDGNLRLLNRRGFYEEVVPNRPVLSKLPLTVLVDGNSASSSEILTGALKDNNRAKVVGTQTFGKALVQAVHPLLSDPAESGLAVTIQHYFTPNGTDISKKGIAPDILVELTAEKRTELSKNPKLIGTMADPQYAKAVAALGVSSIAEQPAKTSANNNINLGGR
jgi:carboxyl-terminal processing protease